MRSSKIPLVLQKKRHFYTNPKWITVDKLYDGPLRFVTNEQLDTFFEQFGKIIVETHHDKDKFGFRTGKRKIRLDVEEDIERWRDIELEATLDGVQKIMKARVNIFYRGQPYHCRACDEEHTDKCPQRLVKEQVEKSFEADRISKVRTLMMGDSNMRRVNEKAFYTRTDCATGAKIGHIANSLEYVKKEDYDVVAVHVGQNNVLQDPDINMGDWQTQMEKEVTTLQSNLQKFNKSILVGVPPAPWCKATPKTAKMRGKINEALRKVTRENFNISFLDIEQEDDDDDANWEDSRHMTEKFTAYMLGKVANKMAALQVKPFVLKNTPWTVSRKHSGVRNTYFLGCEVCTVTGHDKDSCTGSTSSAPPLDEKAPPSHPGKNKKTKRGPPSGSTEPTSKKSSGTHG